MANNNDSRLARTIKENGSDDKAIQRQTKDKKLIPLLYNHTQLSRSSARIREKGGGAARDGRVMLSQVQITIDSTLLY